MCTGWRVVMAMVLAAGAVAAAGPRQAALADSAPGERPARAGGGQEEQRLRGLFIGLVDPDARVRERSGAELMELKREDLPLLQRVVEEFSPLEQTLVAMIREVVTHVYLTGDRYEKDPLGWLGITMPVTQDGAGVGGVDGRGLDVVVKSRMPGFCAFRALEDGDAIVDIDEYRLPKPLARTTFVDVVRRSRPGQMLHLQVLRRGELIRVPVRLDARPAASPLEDDREYSVKVEQLLYRRAREAEAYWRANFEGLAGGAGAGKES